MKILLVSSTFPPRKFGGITESSYQLAKGLVKKGHEVVVYTTDVNDARTRIPHVQGTRTLDGITVHYFKNVSNWFASKRIYSPTGLLSTMREELHDFDIIHLNEFRCIQSILIHYYSEMYSIPYVLQPHGSIAALTSLQKKTLGGIFDIIWGQRILRDAANLIALNRMEVDQCKNFGIAEQKIEIIPNGIDIDQFQNLPEKGKFRRKYNLSENQKIILFLARIHKIKGPDLLVKAFSGLIKQISDVKLVIAGPDDGYLSIVMNLVKELHIENEVFFTGPLYGSDKLEAYTDADVYILPSIYETFPVTVLEAWACGTPVVVTDRCGIADTVNDRRAGIVAPYDKDRLGQAILRIISDDKMSQYLAQCGKALVQDEFKWAKIAGRMESIYSSCLSSKI